jgi:hypothetical protein
MSHPTFDLYPLPSEEVLRRFYVGKSLKDADISAPAAVIDVAIAKRNCDLMLEAVEKMSLGWRAHVKTHKVCHIHYTISTRCVKFSSKETKLNIALHITTMPRCKA